jgi:mRNA interferase RelE/StbE
LLNKFKIAETDTFSSKISESKYNKIYKKITDYVYPQLRENPFFGSNIKKLKGAFEGLYRYRIGNFRIFYKIENAKILVIILDIDNRKDAYK